MGDAGEQALMVRFYADSKRIGKQMSAQKTGIAGPNAEHMTKVASTGRHFPHLTWRTQPERK